METIARIYEVLPKTIANLTDSVDWLVQAQKGHSDYAKNLDTIQDATLKRFDLCYIYLIKTGIARLKSEHQIALRLATPKKIFNMLHQKQLITHTELEHLLATIRIRHLSKQCGDPEKIDAALRAIVDILPALTQIAQKILPKS